MKPPTVSRFRLCGCAVLLLVLLRLALGWQFLYEGWWKSSHASYSAEGFLRQAKGPFARHFHDLIPDEFGETRLNQASMKARWDAYAARAGDHYGFTDEQRKAAEGLAVSAEKQHSVVLKGDLGADQPQFEEIVRYLDDVQKWRGAASDPFIGQALAQQEQHAKKESELHAAAAPWLKEIDRIDDNFHKEIDRLATSEQIAAEGDFSPPWTKLDWVDFATTYGLLAIGIALLAGLFTRLACLSGAVFMGLVVLAQPALPGVFPPPHPSAGHALVVNKEFIEMMILLFMSCTRVGRWGGLDFLVHHVIVRPLFGLKE